MIYDSVWAINDEAWNTVSDLLANLHKYDEEAFLNLFAAQPDPVLKKDKDTAIISIKGPLVKDNALFAMLAGGTTYKSIADAAEDVMSDKKIKNVMIHVDSPGGTVDGVTMASDALAKLKASKSTVGYVDGIAASAGLWTLTAGADKIIGTKTARVGSIGVKARLMDVSAKLEKDGIKVHNIASGKMKAAGDFGEKITDEVIAQHQKHVDAFAEMFISAVANGRNMSVDKVKALATGELFTHAEGLENGLMDATGDESAAFAEFDNADLERRLSKLRS